MTMPVVPYRPNTEIAAVIGGDGANDFLGTQGDVWDTQWDMFLALLGALTAQLVLGRTHDRALARGLAKNQESA